MLLKLYKKQGNIRIDRCGRQKSVIFHFFLFPRIIGTVPQHDKIYFNVRITQNN